MVRRQVSSQQSLNLCTASSFLSVSAVLASTVFASALEECARVKGAGESGDHLLAASGLQYMVANSGQVLVSWLASRCAHNIRIVLTEVRPAPTGS